MGYVFIMGTVVFTVYGQLIIKYELNQMGELPSGPELVSFILTDVFPRPLVLTGLAAAVAASVCWMAALTRFELSFAYPFLALNFVVVVGLSLLLFGESLNAAKLSGIALICLGVLIVARGS